MKKYFALAVLFATAFHFASFAACRIYSLPMRSSIVFRGEKTEFADSVDIVVSVDSKNGRISSPFSITMYDKDKKYVRPTRIYGSSFAMPTEAWNIQTADAPGKDTERIVVSDNLFFEDEHFRLSAKKLDMEYAVVVDDLDARRLDAKVESEAGCVLAETMAPDAPTWPSADGDYKYSSSRTDRFPIMSITDGKMVCTGWLRSKGALYQQEGRLMIRFGLSHETTNGVVVARSEGRVVGEIAHGEIKNSRVTYDVGKDVAKLQIFLPQGNAVEMPHHDEMVKILEAHEIKERTVRLSMVYMGYTRNLDLAMDLHDVTERGVGN